VARSPRAAPKLQRRFRVFSALRSVPTANGRRSCAVRQASIARGPEQTSSLTPLADAYGIITPSSLHFERHHSGVPKIDPRSIA
jgi:hypothetical protein